MDGEDVVVIKRSLASGIEQQVFRMKRQVGRWSNDPSPLLGPPGPVWTRSDDLIVADYDSTNNIGKILRITATGAVDTLLTGGKAEHYLYPRISPDNRTLAYVRYTSHGVGELFTVRLAGGSPVQLSNDLRTIQGISWAPDGQSLLFSSNRNGHFHLWSVRTSSHQVDPVATESTSATDPVYTPAGDIIFVDSRETWNIWRRNMKEPYQSVRFLTSSGRNYDPKYSPDGQRIAFVSDRTGAMELWLADSKGAHPRQATHLGDSWLGGVAWSPDGRQIAFDARSWQRSGIYIVSSDGQDARLLEANGYEERMPSWSKDGKSIYFNSNRDGTLGVWRRELSTGATTKIISNSMFVSQEGDSGMIFSDRTGVIWSSRKDGSHAMPVLPNILVEPVMSWDMVGDRVYFTSDSLGKKQGLYSFSPAAGLREVGSFSEPLVSNAPDISVSPDQSHLLFARQDSIESDLKLRQATAR